MELLEHVKLQSSYFINSHVNFFIKRLFDIFLSVTLILILSPLIIGIGYRLYKREGSPVFYKVPCFGKNKQLFTLYSFRMKTRPRQLIESLPPHPKPEDWKFGVPNSFQFSRDDTFYTQTGIMLKKYYLYKLPQLFNVMKGDMSFVGPRPEDVVIVENYNRQQLNRLRVRPGITGYTQVNIPETSGYDDIVKADLYYISQLSFFFDLKILYRSLPWKNV